MNFFKSKHDHDFDDERSSHERAILGGGIVLTVIFVVLIILCVKCAYRIGPGFAGVVYNANGGIQNETLGQGWHVVLPWQSVTEYPVSTETVYYQKVSNTGNEKKDKDAKDNSINVNTKDGKQVNVDVTYTYHMDQDFLPELFTKFRGRSYDEIENTIMKNEMYQAVNEITSQYTLMDLVGDKRPEVNANIFDKLKGSLSPDGIVLETFNLSDVRPDQDTQTAIQNVVNAQNALAKSKVEKEKAEIEAEQVRITAKGKADAAIIEAEGQAQANNKLQQSLTPMVIQQRQIEKWDGKLPQYQLGAGTSFLLNAGN